MSFISRSGARDEYYVAAEELTAPSRRGGLAPIAMLDGMELTQAQFIGGLRAIDALPEEQRWNALSQTLALQAYAPRSATWHTPPPGALALRWSC